MPLIIITGHPCSGKTTFSKELKAYLEGKGASVVLVNEESEKVNKRDGYADSSREKTTRGVLKSAIDHCLNDKTFVIADSLNYIKGFRYELYCMARTAKTQHCCVLVQCEDSVADAWSAARDELGGKDELGYEGAVMVDLRRRFETPNERNRWDTPLFRVVTTPKDAKVAITAAATAAQSKKGGGGGGGGGEEEGKSLSSPLSSSSPSEGEGTVIVSSFRRKTGGKGGASVAASTVRSGAIAKRTGDSTAAPLVFNRFDALAAAEAAAAATSQPSADNIVTDAGASGTISVGGTVGVIDSIYSFLSTSVAPTPNSSTVRAVRGGVNIADELELVSTDIVGAIIAHQIATDSGEAIPMLFPHYDRKLNLPPRRLTHSELLKLKAHYIKMNEKRPAESAKAAGATFIDFIANHLQ